MKLSTISKFAAGLLAAAAFCAATSLQAAAPNYINYQGKLSDAEGMPVEDAEYTFDIDLGTESGDLIVYDGEPMELQTVDGLYSLRLGPIEDLAGLAANEIFLHLSVEGEAFAPVALNSVVYSLVSNWAAEANSVAPGAITAESLDSGLTTSIDKVSVIETSLVAVTADVAGLDTEVESLKTDTAVEGSLSIGDLVNALREQVQPNWGQADTTFYVVRNVAIAPYAPAFAFSGPSLYNPLTGGEFQRPIVTTSALPAGLVYNKNTDTISGTVTAPVGSYTVDLKATDFLGQVTEQQVTIEVLDINLGPIAASITNPGALNIGALNSGENGKILAGDTVSLSFSPSNAIPASLSDQVRWYRNGAKVQPFNNDVTVITPDTTTLTIAGARNFTSGLPGLPNIVTDSGNYQAELRLSFGQFIRTSQPNNANTFVVGTIEPGFSLNSLTYDGVPFGNLAIMTAVTAGNNSGTFNITANLLPGFNGTANFRWFTEKLGGTQTAMISGAVQQSYVRPKLKQGVDGIALTNGTVTGNQSDRRVYFAAVSNGYADLVSAQKYELQVNDNINLANALLDVTEYAGYPVEFGVVALPINNNAGSVNYTWSWTALQGSAKTVSFGQENTTAIPGDALVDKRTNDALVDYYINLDMETIDGGTVYSKESDQANLIVQKDVVQVANNADVYSATDPVNILVNGIGSNGSFFGIAFPDTDNDAITETITDTNPAPGVISYPTVVLRSIVYVPAAQTSSADEGSWDDNFGTPPARSLTSEWYFEFPGTSKTRIPSSNIKTSYVWIDVDGDGVQETTDRKGLMTEVTLDNLQSINNNNANGTFSVIVKSPYGTYRSGNAVITLSGDL